MNDLTSKIKTKVMLVTPTMALAWLETNNHNRDVSQEWVNKLARDMLMGRWELNHQGIAFFEDGRLMDGQHRLWAVVEAKKNILMQVTTGMPMKAQLSVDGGRPRSTRDVIALRDRKALGPEDDAHSSKAKKLPSETVGVAKLIAEQKGMPKPTRQETIDCYDIYRESINRAVELFPRRVVRIQNAHTVCVITRAIECKESVEELSRFVHILVEGAQPPTDKAQPRDEVVRMLRNSILEPRHLPRRSDTYKKMERALRAYLDHELIKSLYVVHEEIFPLKGDNSAPKLGFKGVAASARRKRGAQLPAVVTNGHKVKAPKPPKPLPPPLGARPPRPMTAAAKKFANTPRLINA